MKPLDTIRAIGRPIAYHAALARHVGGVATAIFLGQLMYWDERSTDDRGVHKESKQWEDETGLSYREQATARKKLRDLGLLIETPERLQHRIYYKLDREAFNAWIEAISKDSDSEIGELPKAHFPNDENAFGGQHIPQLGDDAKRSSLIEKTTTETTTKITETDMSGSAEPNLRALVSEKFQKFWQAYPSTGRKVAKAKCAQIWKARKLDEVADDILSHLLAIKTTPQWLGGYEPAPLTYLNQRRWEDGVPVSAHVASRSSGGSLFEQNMAAAAHAKAMIFGGGNATG
ncbi:hypothetical protein EGT81_12705 [Alcaligenes faecalis]|uniref:hypothetical protein n=1 Tax=Alcaligenes faecalis TaxID=511 RepID=UPI000F663C9A|nr:hypothetical protein [Alcaligenes faecalis]RSE60384.1 hypothetical protein EGT81_12705 [Alcaligenes faecalis]